MQPSSEPASPVRSHAELTALLGAFCFFLSAIEYMIPKPLPFMRLGIANLPILFAADLLPLPWFLVLALVKVVGMSVVSGSLFSIVALFSLTGTMAAALAMWLARRLPRTWISSIGVSVIGALASNAVQLLLASVLVFGLVAARMMAPLFLAMGLLTGLGLGIFAELFAGRSHWYAKARGIAPAMFPGGGDMGKPLNPRRRSDRGQAAYERTKAARASRRERWEALFPAWMLALAGLVVALAFLFQASLAIRAAMLLVFAAAAVLSGKKVSPIASVLVAAGIVVANLLVPFGRLILTVGPLQITEGALLDGLGKAMTFEGLLLLSKASITPTLRLPGAFGSIVAKAFVYYDRIIESDAAIRPGSAIADADSLMLRIWEGLEDADPAPPSGSGSGAGAVLLGLAGLASLALLLPWFR